MSSKGVSSKVVNSRGVGSNGVSSKVVSSRGVGSNGVSSRGISSNLFHFGIEMVVGITSFCPESA